MKKILNRSREKRKNHLMIIIEADDEDSSEKIRMEMKKTIRKLNRLLKKSVGFEMRICINEQTNA